MKKIFSLTLPIGMLILLFALFHASERASGASKNAPIDVENQNGTEQTGPPWFDDAWHYRRQIIISNSGEFLSYYQVMITLDNTNFNFNLAKADGSDLRFTDSTGRNPLLYWIESWDKQNQLAYLWVLVSSLLPEPNNTTIYLYYNNPNATPVSNEPSPFDFFDDDWCQFPSAGCTLEENIQQFQPSLGDGISTTPVISQFSNDTADLFEVGIPTNGYSIGSSSWVTLGSGSPSVSSGSLILNNNTGIKQNGPYQNQAVGFRANYGPGTGYEWAGFINGTSGQRTIIGDLPADVTHLYLINYYNDSSTKLGVNNWHNAYHIYEVRWCTQDINCDVDQSIGDIDHGTYKASNPAPVPSVSLPVTLYNNNSGSATTLMVDWLYVRQYRDPEPTSALGAEQGLVDMGINIVDTPDPLNTSTELTYLLTISNTSIIDAPGVVVKDTLPGSVVFVRANPSLGCSHVASDVECSLNPIAANSTASVTIVVNPTVDGVITNTVTVGSPGFDLDMSNNGGEVATLVDSVPPNVNWEKPVQNGQNYTTYGDLITLEASATDNDRVAWVEFWYWNHIPPTGKITIGIAYTYPYQMQFNSDLLVSNEVYQTFVQAADRAGNISDIYAIPHPVIYIERILLFFKYLSIITR